MVTSKVIHNFEISQKEGHTILTAQEYPWSVLQVVPTTPEEFERTKEILRERSGFVAHHDTDRTFCVIHLTSGDHDGTHPERFIHLTQANYEEYLDALKDTMAQAAVWYYTNVVNLKC